MLVDSHCHLDFPEFAAELDAVVARAAAREIGTMVSIGTTLARFANVAAVAQRYAQVWCSVGIHPHEAETEPLTSAMPLIERAAHPKVVGIGETGLDYYYAHAPRQAQIQNFRWHIAAARDLDLPLIVHTRDADTETIEILGEEMAKGAFTGVIHCFTGSNALRDAALTLGFYISVSGIATFKNAGVLRETLREVPLERLLVETDAPYLAPMPHRGKTNEPAFVAETAKLLAELKNVAEPVLAAATTDNFFRLFKRAQRPS